MLIRLFMIVLLAAPGARAVASEAPPEATAQGEPAAQRAGGVVPLARLVADADRDGLADGLGQRVTVAGRAAVAGGQLRSAPLSTYLYDGTGALHLVGLRPDQPVAAGDSLVAAGTLSHYAGVTELKVEHYTVYAGSAWRPAPMPVDPTVDALENFESRLVRIRGEVVGKGDVSAGTFLNVQVGTRLVIGFVFEGRDSDATFAHARVGQEVELTGFLGQYDHTAPYDDQYQVYPRTAADVHVSGIPAGFYEYAVLLITLLLLGVFGWVASLRRQVRRRVAQLQLSERRYETLFEHAGDAVFVHRLLPDGGFTLVETNPVVTELLGYELRELKALSWHELAAEPSQRAAGAHFARLRRHGHALSEITLVARAGEAIPFEVVSHRVELDGDPAVLSLARDFRKRKEYEAGLIEARREAERLARLRSEFLANMSHEIRTPLTGILGFAEILSEEVDVELRDFTRRIEESGRRLLETINSVLDLARLDADHVTIEPEPLDLAAEVGAAVELLRPLADKKGLVLEAELAASPLPIVTDRAALGRILNNLVGNAIKFTEVGGVHVRVWSGDDEVGIEVEDTGIGIGETFLPRIFDEFDQESKGFGRRHEGSGLGLAISKRLVDLLGGRISVESTVGRGSTFVVVLPPTVPAERAAVLAAYA